MKYCVKCVIPDTRPHIEFNDEGICSACQTAYEKKEVIDWDARENSLLNIFNKFRKNVPGMYDCIIPVSGGKDSIYQVYMVKNMYKMNPLCITFRPLSRTKCGEENLQALRNMGVDHIDFAPNPIGVNKITKKAFLEYGDCSLLDHLAIYSIIPNLALSLQIPLVVWGENPLMEYGGSIDDNKIHQLNKSLLKSHNILKGKSIEDWVDHDIAISEVQSMIYPSDEEMKKLDYTPIFLGYYIFWDSQHNRDMAVSCGFKVREQGPIMGLYDYADLDCMNIVIHHYFKWLKFGFNRISDNASNEIRKGRMTREDAIKLIIKHDGIKPPIEYIEAFCKQINITIEQFWVVVEKFRNQDIWERDNNGEWYINNWIGGDKVPDRFPHLKL